MTEHDDTDTTPEVTAENLEHLRSQHTAQWVADSLNGFEEIDIHERWGADVARLMHDQPSTFGRALTYVVARRRLPDVSPAVLKSRILQLTSGQLAAVFPDSDPEGDTDPLTGKAEQ